MIPTHFVFASLTRISDLSSGHFEIHSTPRSAWETGDYVVGEVTRCTRRNQVELCTGRMIELSVGDWVVGAFGSRAATLESVGDWREIGTDLEMHLMTGAGLIGKTTSRSLLMGDPAHLEYRGHLCRNGTKVTMRDFVTAPTESEINCPVVLIIGTSMSSGKTISAKVIIRRLKQMGLRVTGAKLTGAGRYRDVLAMQDAGADAIVDFVDAGLPSTVCEPLRFHVAFETMMGKIANSRPDVVVAEAGASPVESYNGSIAVSQLLPKNPFTVLCASDPYAVIGVTQGFGFEPSLISGVATSTSAGIEVIRNLAGVEAMNMLDSGNHSRLDEILTEKLNIRPKL